jgi:putative heme-binding domain-containing protein
MSKPLSLRRLLVLPLVLALTAAPLAAQYIPTKVPDPDPELERRSFQVADGFEVNLFAADPLLAKPIQINFDPQGRLWAACSSVYPQIKPGQPPEDRVIVLEDTRGTGKADKVTVFADHLFIPTGLAPGDGGVYVANSTELLHLEDTDGDGKADRRRVVLSGFGTEDTHHMLHTFRWGPDGMLYMNQSVYIHSHIETPYGPRRLGGGGTWQYRPETQRLEVFARGWINHWGHQFDRWGQSFVTDGAGGEGINYVIPGGFYAWAPNADRMFLGLNPGSPKYCGEEIISGRHFPEDWQGNIITNDFRGHRVCRFVLSEDGAGFAAREVGELIKTTHEAFRPVDVQLGPDGALYIADWYNPIINHGEVDFRDPRRDHVHGRIWRVTYKGRPLVQRPQLVHATTEAVLDALKAPEGWTRAQAKRVLQERGAAKVLPALAAWLRHLEAAEPQHEHHLLEALWMYQSLDTVEPQLLTAVLQAHDRHARAAAVRVLGYWHDRLPNPLELLTPRVADEHPRVRLEAVRALGRIPDARAAELALRVLDHPMDRFLDYGLFLTMRELEPQWVPALQKGQVDFSGDVRRLTFALQAAGPGTGARPLVELIRSGKVPPEREADVLALLAGLGGPAELGLVFDRITDGAKLTPEGRARVLEALAQAARQRKVRPAGDPARVGQLLDAGDDAVRAAAARLAGLWQIEALRPRLLELATSGSGPVRQAAIDGLAALGGSSGRAALTELAGAGKPPEVRRAAVAALAGLDPAAAAPLAVDVLASANGQDPTDVVAAFMQQKNGPALLTKALAGRKLPTDTAKVAVRAVSSSGHADAALTAALTKAGGLTGKARELTPAEMRQLMADVHAHGDPARGEAIFRRGDLSCLKCHAIGGAGGLVGPDLVSIGASAPVDYLVESILLPNKAVKENYHAMIVATDRGQIFTGIKVRESDRELVLRDAEDREVSIPADSIEERKMGGSLMPEGLADSLTRAELVDLVRFLSELGKVGGKYTVGKERLARRWQALAPSKEAYDQLSRTGLGAAARDNPPLTWAPAYSTVAGVLPLADLPELGIFVPSQSARAQTSFVRCQLDATTGGKVLLRLNSAEGLTAWLDREPVAVKEALELDLSPGRHTLTLAVYRDVRHAPLRCELDDVPGSPAHAQVVGGK